MGIRLEHEPLVTIVTPVFNRRSSIRACLQSVKSQTHKNIEHIVVDGASTDGTLEELEKFATQHPLKIISEPDSGMYEAVNKGLKIANGQFHAYLNSDDLYLPWSIASSCRVLQRGADIAHGDIGLLRTFDRGDAFWVQFNSSFSISKTLWWGTLSQPATLWRSAVTSRLQGFDESYKLFSDIDFWLRAAVAGLSFRYVKEVLAICSDHPQSLTNMNREIGNQERERHQSLYSDAAGRPPNARLTRIIESIRWRSSEFKLAAAVFAKSSRSWPEFSRFLNRHNLKIENAYRLAPFTPPRFRPDQRELSMVDPEAFERSIMEEIGLLW